MSLTELIRRPNIVFLEETTKEDVLRALVATAAANEEVVDEEKLLDDIMDREREYTTGIGLGIAVPHARSEAVTAPIVVLGRCRVPIDFDALDGHPVTIVVMIAVGPNQHKTYIRALARVVQTLKDDAVRAAIGEAESSDAIWTILAGSVR